MSYYDDVADAADAIRARVRDLPPIAIVLGSGLGEFTSELTGAVSIPYGELPNWPAARVIGHDGRLVVGRVCGRTVAALAGRCHLYEGHDMRTVTFAVRALGLLGVKTLILTNAAGGVNTGFSQGALMVIDDHVNLMGGNPLVGANDDRFGPRFPDMTEVYSARLRGMADQAGEAIVSRCPTASTSRSSGPVTRPPRRSDT
jgi:purine-nucleoside phosphorylase